MKKIICRLSSGEILPGDIYLADSFYSRLVGLMFSSFENKKGLLLVPGHSIHTCFMRYALDVIFMDKENKIIKIVRNMKPWRVTGFCFNSQKTLELPAGNLPSNVTIGQQLEISHV